MWREEGQPEEGLKVSGAAGWTARRKDKTDVNDRLERIDE